LSDATESRKKIVRSDQDERELSKKKKNQNGGSGGIRRNIPNFTKETCVERELHGEILNREFNP